MMSKKRPDQQEKSQTDDWSTWEKEPSEFPWFYSDMETCYIMQGKATVVSADGATIEFEAGDLVVFEQGLECTWKISERIVKKYKFG